MRKKIKDCPICGDKAELFSANGCIMISCSGCENGIVFDIDENEFSKEIEINKIINLWNERAF